MIFVNPSDVITFRAKGTGNMGTVADEQSVARFKLAEKFVLAWIKCKFSGGSSSATLTMYSDHNTQDVDSDFVEESWATMGTGGTANMVFRPRADELHRYVYQPGDELVFVWTNPNTQRWSIEVGLVPARLVDHA